MLNVSSAINKSRVELKLSSLITNSFIITESEGERESESERKEVRTTNNKINNDNNKTILIIIITVQIKKRGRRAEGHEQQHEASGQHGT